MTSIIRLIETIVHNQFKYNYLKNKEFFRIFFGIFQNSIKF